MSQNFYEKLSEERKQLQLEGKVPEWYNTGGYQMFKERYEYQTNGGSIRAQYERIAKTAASHLPETGPLNKYTAEEQFFKLIWNRWLSLSTPVAANMGTDRGLPVSCAGQKIFDSVDSFFSNLHETAMLTKHGFGTSAYLGDIRPRGSKISVGGKASGVVPVFDDFVRCMRKVTQGTARRGAWAGYLPMSHGDYNELADHIMEEPDDANVGWILNNYELDKLNANDPDMLARWQKAMKLKLVTGKGYFSFMDKSREKTPIWCAEKGLHPVASNLCEEIRLFSGMWNDKSYTFTCVLSSMVDATYREWKNEKAPFWATVFLDCVAAEFIKKAEKIPALESAVRFTKDFRALGLGQCGLHTLFQQEGIPFESFEAHMLSNEIAEHIRSEAEEATRLMAQELGEPLVTKGYGRRNSHLIAIPPTKSSAAMVGGISEGINPDPGMTFQQATSAGEIDRVTPIFLDLLKNRGKFNKKVLKSITENKGSVQHLDFLSDHEKQVFKTAFEINQKSVLRLASSRANWIDQWQSLNLFFAADADPSWISEVHYEAAMDPNILGLYYIYTMSGVNASQEGCVACQ